MKTQGSLPSVLLITLLFMLCAQVASAGSATWNFNPINGDWNTATNWTPSTVPNGLGDLATFDISNQTDVTFSANAVVNQILFDLTADTFDIILPASPGYFALDVYDGGIRNNSGHTQQFEVGGGLQFRSTAPVIGHPVTFTIDGGTAATSFRGGSMVFNDTSSAGASTIFIEGGSGDPAAEGGSLYFSGQSKAANALLIAVVGTEKKFAAASNIQFSNDSSGGTAVIDFTGRNTYLLISNHNAPGLTIGSLQGNGRVFLGLNRLVVGSNDFTTEFSGVIQDSGSLSKIGRGNLVLRGASLYTGGTTVNGGKLDVSNDLGSGTGTGPVQVKGGRLGGSGTIAGTVTVGTGSGPGAILAPIRYRAKPRTLTIQSSLTLNADATYKCTVNSNTATADRVVGNGATINGANFSLADSGNSTLATGTTLTVIENTAATPIAGTFANLADGSTLSAGNNTFQANYAGGDGNDLTLMVVP